jgi:hypothetical protein
MARKLSKKTKEKKRDKRHERARRNADVKSAETFAEAARQLDPRSYAALMRFSLDESRNVGAEEYASLGRALREFDSASTIATLGGLLTIPDCHAETIRIEHLLHLAVLHCAGTRTVDEPLLREWLERTLAELPIRRMEDPCEDVFVANVTTPEGNYRIFEGIWESNADSLQGLLDALGRCRWAIENMAVIESTVSLLKLSEAVAERSNLPRWTASENPYPSDAIIPQAIDLGATGARVIFSASDLTELRVSRATLAPFILSDSGRRELNDESTGHSSLERFPVIEFQDTVVLACPSAVSAAIRRFVVSTFSTANKLSDLEDALRVTHAETVFSSCLPFLDAPPGFGAGALPSEPATQGPFPWNEVHCPIDEDKVAQVILLFDALDDIEEVGLVTPGSSSGLNERLNDHIRETTRRLAEHARGGLVLIISAGIGRGWLLGLPTLPPRWHTIAMPIADFETFAWSQDASLLRLWKLYEEIETLAAAGVSLFESNGTLNTYAFWQKQGFALMPAEFPYPPAQHAHIAIGTEFVFEFRVAQRRLGDVHTVRLSAARSVRVGRLARDVYFPAMRDRPIFASEEFARGGKLVGVVESAGLTIWVWGERTRSSPDEDHFVFQLWECLLSWLDRLLPRIGSYLNSVSERVKAAPPVHLLVVPTDDPRWDNVGHPGNPEPELPSSSVDPDNGTVSVSIPFGFVGLLRRPANDAERALLEDVAFALLDLLSPHSRPISEPRSADEIELLTRTCSELVGAVMGGQSARTIHLFEARTPSDHLSSLPASGARRPIFVAPEDAEAWQIGLAWLALDRSTLLPSPTGTAAGVEAPHDSGQPTEESNPLGELADDHVYDERREILGQPRCSVALNSLVVSIWEKISDRLKELSGTSLAKIALVNLELIAADREQWRRTARAVTALFGDDDDVERIAGLRESVRAETAIACRVLAEMAICTTPTTGGRITSIADFEFLTAGISLLVSLASASDAIFNEVAEARISVFPNGAVVSDRTFLADIVGPYALEVHAAGYRDAATEYDQLYESRATDVAESAEPPTANETGGATTSTTRSSPFSDSFVAAFQAEYGLSPDRLPDAVAELTDIAMSEGTAVVETTLSAVGSRLMESRGFSAKEVEAFFKLFALVRREDWTKTPAGFKKRDWEPWRFRRRLSLVARPLLIFGDAADRPLLFGVHQVAVSMTYLLENIKNGWLPEQFFRSREMRSYRGSVANTLGHAFTEQVSKHLESTGWTTRTEVQMRTLGAPDELGDLDVVAWRADSPRVLLVECKRLQPAGTIGEVVELLTQFRGEAKDRLGRHLRRCGWVREHREALLVIGVPNHATEVHEMLVTNRDVPMTFRTDLPLKPEQIVPFRMLRERI